MKNIIDSKGQNMKKKIKILMLFIVFIVFLIVIFLNTNNKTVENKMNEQPHENIEGENKVEEFTSKINIQINGTNYTATLEDNATSREFIKKLPLELNMSELNGSEKYYFFDDPFPSNPSLINKIKCGDLMLYHNDCFVLFYETLTNTTYRYTRIGKIDQPTSLKDSVGKENIKISITK